MCDSREVRLPWRVGECGEHAAVEITAPNRRDRVLDCKAGQLVPEADCRVDLCEEPRCEALLEVYAGSVADRFEKPRLDSRRSDRDGLEDGDRPVA